MTAVQDRSLLSGAAGSLVVRGAISVFQFATLLYLARMITPEVFAEAAFLPIAARLGALLALRGGTAIVLGTASVNPDRAIAEVWREFDRARHLATGIGVVIAVLFALTFNKTSGETVLALVWWPPAVLLTSFWMLVAEHLKGTLRVNRAILLEFAPLSLAFGALAAAAGFGWTPSASAVAVAFVGSQLIAVLAAAPVVWAGAASRILVDGPGPLAGPGGQPGPVVDPRSPRSALTFSTVFTLALPLVVISLVSILGSPTDAGRLAAVIRLLSPTTIVVAAAAASFVPRIVIDRERHHGDRPFDRSPVRWSVASVAMLTVPYSLILFINPGLLETLLGDQYAGLHTALRIVAIGQMCRGLAGVAVELGQVSGHAAADARAVLVGAAVGVAAWPLLATTVSVTAAGAFLFSCLVASRSFRMFVVSYLRVPKAVPVAV
ncbi:MAG: hypothetical protein AAF531_10035 [Actinomycetota bacterium]